MPRFRYTATPFVTADMKCLQHLRVAAYLRARIHSTSVLRSASGTLFGGMGIWPQTPLPPFLTFCSSFVLDAANGNTLYKFNTGGTVGGGVLTYEIDGKQYVATTSGVVSGFFGGHGTSALVVFALH